MKFSILLTLLFCSFAKGFPLPCTGTYKVALNESEPLYLRDSKTRRDSGISVEFLEELSQRTRCKYVASPINRSRLLIELKAHRVDFVIMTVKNATFDQLAKPITVEHIAREMLISKSLISKYKTIQDAINDPSLRFLILPAVTIYFTPEEIAKLEREQRFITTPTIENSYQLLKRTKNTAVIQTDFVNQYFQNTLNMKTDFSRLGDKTKSAEVVIYHRSGIRVEDIAAITKAVDEIVTDGTWKKIKDKYANFPPEDLTKHK